MRLLRIGACPGSGGGRGIRTPEAHHLAVFKTAAINHSAIPPEATAKYNNVRFRWSMDAAGLTRSCRPLKRRGREGLGRGRLAQIRVNTVWDADHGAF